MSFLEHKKLKRFSNWSFQYTPKNDHITTPMCLLAFSPVFGLHVPFSPNTPAIKIKNYGKIITPKHPPNQGNWTASSLCIRITQIWASVQINLLTITGIPVETGRRVGSRLPDQWGSVIIPLSSHLLFLLWRDRAILADAGHLHPQVDSAEASRLQKQERSRVLVFCWPWTLHMHYRAFIL